MIGALLILLVFTLFASGGVDGIYAGLKDTDVNLVRLFPTDLAWGFIPFFLGWLVAGFGGVGQPHIVVRGDGDRFRQTIWAKREIYGLFAV